jgi:hypothetical protein
MNVIDVIRRLLEFTDNIRTTILTMSRRRQPNCLLISGKVCEHHMDNMRKFIPTANFLLYLSFLIEDAWN